MQARIETVTAVDISQFDADANETFESITKEVERDISREFDLLYKQADFMAQVSPHAVHSAESQISVRGRFYFICMTKRNGKYSCNIAFYTGRPGDRGRPEWYNLCYSDQKDNQTLKQWEQSLAQEFVESAKHYNKSEGLVI